MIEPDPWLQGGWTALYLTFAAIMTAGLSALAEREQKSRIRALRRPRPNTRRPRRKETCARLLQSYQSQRTDFRCWSTDSAPPIASLAALMDA